MAVEPLRIQVLASPEQSRLALRNLATWAEQISLAYAWMSGANGRQEHWSILPLSKLTRAVVGIHFAQTEPAVLRALAAHGVLRVVPDTGGVFHPKVLVGRRGSEAQALVGSSNFTLGGFAGNTELNLHLIGPADSDVLVKIQEFVDEQWFHPRCFPPDEEWLARYEQMYLSRPRPPRIPASSQDVSAMVTSPADLDIGWSDYFDLISKQERRALSNGWEIRVFDCPDGSYLQEVESCQRAFASNARFADNELQDRKLIAGWGGDSVGYFGRMRGAGRFKNLTAEAPETIGRALDLLPLHGDVSLGDAERVLERLVDIEGVALGAATRLVSMKRPDLFFPANNASVPQISRVFAIRPGSVPRYMEVLGSIWKFPWFSTSRPRDKQEKRIWRARVALLDAIFYEPSSRPEG